MNFRSALNKRIFWIVSILIMIVVCLMLTPQNAYASETTTSKYTGITYTHSSALKGYIVANGIDISNWQEDVDWARIKADGIDFAIIRAGGRGYRICTFAGRQCD